MIRLSSILRWHASGDDAPPEIFNCKLYLSIFVFGILGAARGLDEGNISANMGQISFRKQFGIDDPNKSPADMADLQSNIASMVQLGSVGGAFLAMFIVDRIGRLNSLRLLCACWAASVIVQITSFSVGQLYAGRVIEGLAIGQATTIGPTYLSEVAPSQIRGLCGCIFAGAVYLGVMLSYFANYGTALHISDNNRNQWVIPTCVKIIFAASILILSIFFGIESPLWLIKTGRPHEAAKCLSKLRGLPSDSEYLAQEFEDMSQRATEAQKAREGSTFFGLVKEIFSGRPNQYRMWVLGVTAQLLGQWGGANAVTIYAPELFASIGIKGKEKLKMTAVLGVVKFVSAYLSAFFIIDVLGRRPAMYIGICIQLVCELYYAIFLSVVPISTGTDARKSAGARAAQTPLNGASGRAASGALAAIFLSGTGWCVGFNNIQYLMGSEIFPLRVRPVANSIIMMLHFANQYGNSKALPRMMLEMKPEGAFYFFVAVLVLSLFWVWFFVPEVSGLSSEKLERVFLLPWHIIGRKGAQLTHDDVGTVECIETQKVESASLSQKQAFEYGASKDDSEESKD